MRARISTVFWFTVERYQPQTIRSEPFDFLLAIRSPLIQEHYEFLKFTAAI